jgi:hypothetical protein
MDLGDVRPPRTALATRFTVSATGSPEARPVAQSRVGLPSSGLSPWLAVSLLVALGAALRVRALFTDFWLDEIWSYEEIARRARSVVDIFLNPAFKLDNNHYLNSVFLFLLGERNAWAIYRLPAFVAGLLTIGVATRIGGARNRAEGWIFGTLVATSFVMVVYSTEARGYAWLLLFALLAFLALRRYFEKPSLGTAVLFWIWTALGLTAHSTMFEFYLAAFIWSSFRFRGRAPDFRRLHDVPVFFAVVWFLVVYLGSRGGGGVPWRWVDIVDQSLAWTLGYPTTLIPAALAGTLVAALVFWNAWAMRREGSDEGWFILGVVLVPPVLTAALAPAWLFPRYFLVSLLFLLLVLGQSLGRLWRQAWWGRPAVVAILVCFALGNLRHIVPFSEYGRGQASQAIRDIVADNGPGPVTLTGMPVEIAAQLPIRFYSDAFGLGTRITYVPQRELTDTSSPRVEWVIAISPLPCTKPASRVTLPSSGTYSLRRAYPAYGPSGLCWFVYRRAAEDP